MEPVPARLLVLRQAIDQTGSVLARLTEDQLHHPTPCADWDVAAVIDHLLGSTSRFVAWIGGQWTRPAGDDLAAWKRAYHEGTTVLLDTWSAPGAAARTYQGPTGEIAADQMLSIQTTEFLAHGWDLAKATDQLALLHPAMAEQALAMIQGMLPAAARGATRSFAGEVPVPTNAPPYDRLAGYLGRQP